jgi:ribosomal protein L11 methyltransferase
LKGARVVDFGCGSGILAIAALLLGAAQADCVDIDPQAHLATRSNAEINGVDNQIRLLDAEALTPAGYDLVMANILAGPLIELAPVLCQLMAPGGQIVISGILFEQAAAIQSAYAPHCSDCVITRDHDWIRMTARCIPSA